MKRWEKKLHQREFEKKGIKVRKVEGDEIDPKRVNVRIESEFDHNMTFKYEDRTVKVTSVKPRKRRKPKRYDD